MGCKKCPKKIKTDDVIVQKTENKIEPQILFYVYCPACEEIRARRITAKESVGLKCNKCNGPTMKFNRPPSMHKLRNIKLQRFGG
jgi:translation initiation factor 2 beta subunit (eIF-2beta)/eIF-5